MPPAEMETGEIGRKMIIRGQGKKRLYRFWAAAFCLIQLLLFAGPGFTVNADSSHHDYTAEEIREAIEGGIAWKKEDSGILNSNGLLNGPFLNRAGDTTGDWYAIVLGRLGTEDNFHAYQAVLAQNVAGRYQTQEKLDKKKATEWHRIALAFLAVGGDPTAVGSSDGETRIDLIADGTYDRGKTEALGAQGLNAYIWGLITLDSLHYKVPDGASDTRADMVTALVESQLPDGGFSLEGRYGAEGDVDITAMTIQALAPYYNSNEKFGEESSEYIRNVVDRALVFLSEKQTDSGGFESWGAENLESTAQVILALCSLGRDPIKEEGFEKNGRTLLDGLMQYRREDGGFLHSFDYDESNPSSRPDESNSMATEQALCALTALYRHYGNFRNFYDFRPEMEAGLKEQIQKLELQIDEISEDTEKGTIEQLFEKYKEIPSSERSYVSNYWKLSDHMKKNGIIDDADPLSAAMEESAGGCGSLVSLFEEGEQVSANILFTEEDKAACESFPEALTTENYGEVVALLDKLGKAENRAEYAELIPELEAKKEKIESIQEEIIEINQEILEKLYPFETISIGDKQAVEEISERIGGLSDYDKAQIQGAEDVLRARTQIDNQIRMIIIGAAVLVVLILLSIVLVIRMKRRKKRKLQKKMLLPEQGDEEESDF